MIKNFIKAARLRTLPLSVSGIIVGSSLGARHNFDILSAKYFDTTICVSYQRFFESPIFWLAILTTIGFQVLSNFANDYGDGVKGTDENRTGEARMVATGAISAKQMKKAMVITTIITLIVAIALIYLAFGEDNFQYSLLFFILGIASIAAAIKYTVGKSAYGYSGFGDLFVFLFFGLLSVLGSYFLFTQQIDYWVFLPAFTVGCLSTAVLNLNNMRDRENDKKSGKNTIVVKIGAQFAKYYHYYLIGSSLLFALLYTSITLYSPLQYVYIIAYIPLIKHLYFVYKNNQESELDGQLKVVALSTFLFALLFGIGQVL